MVGNASGLQVRPGPFSEPVRIEREMALCEISSPQGAVEMANARLPCTVD